MMWGFLASGDTNRTMPALIPQKIAKIKRPSGDFRRFHAQSIHMMHEVCAA